MEDTIAWCAGLFEGEGYIRASTERRNRYEIGIKMTDLDVLKRFQTVFGGHIGERKKRQESHKQIWELEIVGKKKIKHVLEAMLPYFGERRLAAAKAKIAECS